MSNEKYSELLSELTHIENEHTKYKREITRKLEHSHQEKTILQAQLNKQTSNTIRLQDALTALKNSFTLKNEELYNKLEQLEKDNDTLQQQVNELQKTNNINVVASSDDIINVLDNLEQINTAAICEQDKNDNDKESTQVPLIQKTNDISHIPIVTEEENYGEQHNQNEEIIISSDELDLSIDELSELINKELEPQEDKQVDDTNDLNKISNSNITDEFHDGWLLENLDVDSITSKYEFESNNKTSGHETVEDIASTSEFENNPNTQNEELDDTQNIIINENTQEIIPDQNDTNTPSDDLEDLQKIYITEDKINVDEDTNKNTEIIPDQNDTNTTSNTSEDTQKIIIQDYSNSSTSRSQKKKTNKDKIESNKENDKQTLTIDETSNELTATSEKNNSKQSISNESLLEEFDFEEDKDNKSKIIDILLIIVFIILLLLIIYLVSK